jgi:hypothetical protein
MGSRADSGKDFKLAGEPGNTEVTEETSCAKRFRQRIKHPSSKMKDFSGSTFSGVKLPIFTIVSARS